jgi:hypothetical protein
MQAERHAEIAKLRRRFAEQDTPEQAETLSTQLARQRRTNQPEPPHRRPEGLHHMTAWVGSPRLQPRPSEERASTLPEVAVFRGEPPSKDGVVEQRRGHQPSSVV